MCCTPLKPIHNVFILMNDESISLCQQKNQANEHRELCPGVLNQFANQIFQFCASVFGDE